MTMIDQPTQTRNTLKVGDIWTDSDGDVMQVCADRRSYCIIRNEEISRLEATIRCGLAAQFGTASPRRMVTR